MEKAQLPPLVRQALDYSGPAIFRVTSRIYGPAVAETLLEQVCTHVLNMADHFPEKYKADSTRVNWLVCQATVKAAELHKLLIKCEASPKS